MTDHSITIENAVNAFGGSLTDDWAAHNWGAFLWGEGTEEMVQYIGKYLLDDATALESAILAKSVGKLVSNTLSPDGDLSSQVLMDGSGYTYIFPANATDGEARDPVDWSAVTDGSATWTDSSSNSTDWEES